MGLWEARPRADRSVQSLCIVGAGAAPAQIHCGRPPPGRSILAPAIHVGARAPLLQQLAVRQSTRAGETLAVVLYVAEGGVYHGQALGVVTGGKLVAHAHAAVHLYRLLADHAAGAADLDFGRRHRALALVRIL